MSTVISAADPGLRLRELKNYSALLRYLSLRDVYVRYKQTMMGFGWSVARPLVNMLIFGAFSYLIDPSEKFASRFAQVAGAMVFWQLISTTITEVSNSLLANSNILTKVYFPKLILPLSSLLVCIVDFLIAFVLFLVLYLILYGLPPPQILLLPLVTAYGLLFSFGVGLLASAAAVKFRDVKFVVPFLLQILLYVSPVFISTTFILGKTLPGWLLAAYQMNPLALIFNAFKWCLFGKFDALEPVYAAVSVFLTLVILVFALRYFTKAERSFADFI